MFNKKKMEEKLKDINEDSFNNLSKGILKEKNVDNDYQEFLSERKAMLPLSKEDRDKVEMIIKIEILKIFNKSKIDAQSDDENIGFFKYKPFREIEYLKEYFNIISVSGDRNIGKSYSSHEEIRDVVAGQRKFMMIRNIDDEVKAQLESDSGEGGWITGNGWVPSGSAKMAKIVNLDNSVVGYYRALNTSAKFKSTDFPGVDLIVYEEFNEVSISDKYMKFVKFVSSIIRFNPDGWAILQANYVDQQDEVLQALGVGGKTLTAKDFVIFNWEVGAILIFVPSGIYRKPKDLSKDLAYRASLAKYGVWKSQYGGGFSNEEPINIIDDKNFSSIEPVFNIYHQNVASNTSVGKKYGAYKMTLYKVYDNEGKMFNVLTTTKGSNDKPVFIYDYLNKILYPKAHLMSVDSLDELINQWNKGNLKTTDMEIHMSITALFAQAKKALDKDDDDITEVESIFG